MSALRALAEGEATAAYQGLAARRGGPWQEPRVYI